MSAHIATAQIITTKRLTREIVKHEWTNKRKKQNFSPKKLNAPPKTDTVQYKGFVEAGYDCRISDGIGFSATTIHGIRMNKYIYVGAGTGVQAIQLLFKNGIQKLGYTIPIFCDTRVYFTRTAVIPFAEAQIGYAISCNGSRTHIENLDRTYIAEYKGLFCGVGLGIEYKMLNIKVLWKAQNRENSIIDSRYKYNNKKYMDTNLLSIAVGINF